MDFILISDAVKITGLDRQTIRNWMAKGIIPYQKINGTFYVDKDTFVALSDKMKDVDGTRARLEALRDDYLREMDEYRTMQESARHRQSVNRYLSICVNSGIRTGFFRTVVDIMNRLHMLTAYESQVLVSLLDGASLEELCEKYQTSREKVRQIAEKAIRKSRDIMPFEDMQKDLVQKDEEIKSLKDEITVLKKMVYQQVINVTEANLGEIERKLVRMDTRELNALFSRVIVNEDLSVRALNICMMLGVRTIGDLCRLTASDFLKARNSGRRTLGEVTDFLKSNGLSWGVDVDSVLRMKC